MSDPVLGAFSSTPFSGLVDVHCHILPGIDDGPDTVEAAVGLCRVMVREGVEIAVATPHQLGRYDGTNSAASVRSAVEAFKKQLERFHLKLDVRAGAEVRLDERIPKLLEQDQILTLADGKKYLLLELPSGLAFDVAAVMGRVSSPGIRVVLAHTERYEFMRGPGVAEKWRDAGVILQVNGSSLAGGWGPQAQSAGWDLLSRGVVTLVASDAHSVGQRRPRWNEAATAIISRLGEDTMKKLCIENPRAVLRGENLD